MCRPVGCGRGDHRCTVSYRANDKSYLALHSHNTCPCRRRVVEKATPFPSPISLFVCNCYLGLSIFSRRLRDWPPLPRAHPLLAVHRKGRRGCTLYRSLLALRLYHQLPLATGCATIGEGVLVLALRNLIT